MIKSSQEIIKFQYLIAPGIACFIAQFLKIFKTSDKIKKIEWKRFLHTGGMPSSHSATVTALVVEVGFHLGVSSSLFAIVFVFASIVVYDAVGLRQSVGKQAKLLNLLVSKLKHTEVLEKEILQKELREAVGHSFIEVLMGIFLGVAIAMVIR